MELFHGDDSNEAFSGFVRFSFWKVMMSLTKLMITNEGPEKDLLRYGPHMAMLIW